MSTTFVETCINCTQPIHFAAPAGATPIQRDLYTHWRHVDTGAIGCTGSNTSADPTRCHRCDSRNIAFTQEAWGDATTCLDCGHRRFVSIGD